MNYIIIVGFIAAFLTSMAFIPQVIQVIRDKQTDGISLPMYLIFVTGVICWIIYGILVKDMAILIANVITFTLAFPVLIVVVKNRS
jgi:MtN3 and saliva related transmembrane protein